MEEVLAQCELFRGLDARAIARLAAIASCETRADGEWLFTLGDEADHIFVILQGAVEITLPLSVRGSVRDVTVESKASGSAVGLSAFVSPHRFRMSAQAAGQLEVAAFARSDLEALFDSDPALGYRFTLRVAEVMAQRLLKVHALWVRELQHRVTTVE